MATLAETKERVQSYLTRFGSVTIDSDGDFSVPAGSTRVFVRVREHPNNKATLVDVWAIVLRDVQPSPELYEYCARSSGQWVFGHLEVYVNDEQNDAFIIMTHRLLGDFLDLDELAYVVLGIAGSADDLDDDLKSRFGGRKFHD